MVSENQRGNPVSTFLVWSIFNTVCCCFPIGIVAIVFSVRTDTANTMGDATTANAHSRMAKNLNIAATVTGVILIIIGIAVYVAVLVPSLKHLYNMG